MNLVNTDIEYKKLGDICVLLPKSERPVSYGKEKGLYPFYITPGQKKVYCDNADYNEEAIIIGEHCIPGSNVNIKLSKCFSCSEHNFIINLQVSEQEVIRRLTARGRADDKPEVIKQRLREHEKQVGPVIKHFDEQLINIKAEGAEPEVIANKIIKRIER